MRELSTSLRPQSVRAVVDVKYFGRSGGDYLRDGVVMAVHKVDGENASS
jgi:hypothetical protein